ncbi:hypothetical protein SRHO_G00111970 [Serrasalmus rhombeus]
MKKAPLWEASEAIVPLWRDICTVQTRERWKGRDLPMSTNSWQMAGLTPVSSPASMRHPVSENQMNHFHRTDALLTDRLSRPRSSTLLALELTARSEEPALWLSPGR